MDDKDPSPLGGCDIAPLKASLGNTPAPHQYSTSKSDGYRGGREAMDAIMAEYKQLRIKNMAEAEEMQEKLSTTVGESEEVQNLHMAQYMNCYKKAKAVLDEPARRLAVIGAEVKCMLNRIYGGEEISQEEGTRFLERMLEIVERPYC